MNDDQLKNALLIISSNLPTTKFTWRLEGSANLRIQGVKTDVNDLDITTNERGLDIFKIALKEYLIKEYKNNNKESHILLFKIKDCEVEVASYKNTKKNYFDKIKFINYNSSSIPILPLTYAKESYKLINKPAKVRLIEKHLVNF